MESSLTFASNRKFQTLPAVHSKQLHSKKAQYTAEGIFKRSIISHAFGKWHRDLLRRIKNCSSHRAFVDYADFVRGVNAIAAA